jgi:hypothetical protein
MKWMLSVTRFSSMGTLPASRAEKTEVSEIMKFARPNLSKADARSLVWR